MPRSPRPKTAFLFAVPIMAHAGPLALWPLEEATLAGVVPRFAALCAITCAIAWIAAPSEEGRGDAAGTVASIALATLGAGAFAFVLCLAWALVFAGALAPATLIGIGVFAMMAVAGVAILAYVLGTAFDVGPKIAVMAMAVHCAVLAPLMTHPSRPAAATAACIAAASCVVALFLANRQAKMKPAP